MSTIQVNLESDTHDVSNTKPRQVAPKTMPIDEPAKAETRNETEQGDNLESRAGDGMREEEDSCEQSVTTKSSKSSQNTTSSKKKKSIRKRVTSKIGSLLRKAGSHDGSKASKLSKESDTKKSEKFDSGSGLPPRPEKVKDAQVAFKEETKDIPEAKNDGISSDPPGELGSSERGTPAVDTAEAPEEAHKDPLPDQECNPPKEEDDDDEEEEEEEEDEEDDNTDSDIPTMIHAGSMGATTRLTEPDHMQEVKLPLETLASAFTGCLDHSSAEVETEAEEVLEKPVVQHVNDDIGLAACATYYCGVNWTDISQSLGQYVAKTSEEAVVFDSPAMALENAVEDKSSADAAASTDETPNAGTSYGNPTNTLVLPPGKSMEETQLALRQDITSGCINDTAVSVREIERVVLFTDIPDPKVDDDEEESNELSRSIKEVAERVTKETEKVVKEVERVMFFTDVPDGFAKNLLGESPKEDMAMVESKEGISEDLKFLVEGSVSIVNASLAVANKEFEELNMRASALFSGNAKEAKDLVELNAQIANEAAEGLLQGLNNDEEVKK